MKIQGSKILITGGSSGLGKATAELLIQSGAKVAITGRDEAKLKRVANEIGAIPIAMDISDYGSLAEKSKAVLDQLGGLDVLINNAGIGDFAKLGEIKLEHFEKVFATNVFGLTMLTQEFLPTFKAQGFGDIVNIASTAALKGFASGSVYSASKFALRSLTQCWQQELRRDNIRVMLVNPSEVPTAFYQKDRVEKPQVDGKLSPVEIAHSIKSVLEMDNRGFIPELTVWATNPFGS